MANNRMWLLHRPTGKAVFLGKRMGWGWYGTPAGLTSKIEALFKAVCAAETNQDDFCLAMEECSEAPEAFESWEYTDLPAQSMTILRVKEREG